MSRINYCRVSRKRYAIEIYNVLKARKKAEKKEARRRRRGGKERGRGEGEKEKGILSQEVYVVI